MLQQEPPFQPEFHMHVMPFEACLVANACITPQAPARWISVTSFQKSARLEELLLSRMLSLK
jgi:hypothetical protein